MRPDVVGLGDHDRSSDLSDPHVHLDNAGGRRQEAVLKRLERHVQHFIVSV
jgi:hypothetical protein